MSALPRIVITPGEPAGIGPDLICEIAQQRWAAELVAVADPELLAQRAAMLGLPLRLVPFDPEQPPQASLPGELQLLPVSLATPARIGMLDVRNAPYVLDTLRQAADCCLLAQAQALVTGPVQKSVINDAGIAFSGHTEFLAQYCAERQRVSPSPARSASAPHPVMMLVAGSLRVALLTTHLPLHAVPAAITAATLKLTLEILDADLRHRFGIAQPRILVCGLNPHAGESGHLGREEIDIIEPALEVARAAGINAIGPLPADTLFTPKYLDHADAVLAMYHDQGLPVLKYAGFGQAINITLGLPIIRTSVDHGTALDLAGSGKAQAGSLRAALQLAIELGGP